MYFDAYEGLSEEYRSYRMIQPEQLNFRQASNDSERMAATTLNDRVKKDARTLIIVGIVMIVLGALIMTQSLGGIGLIIFGIAPIIFGVIKGKSGKAANLISTGTLVKKEKRSGGSVKHRSRQSYYWLVIVPDDMENTLCIVHAEPETFGELRVGDRVLVTNDELGYYGKKMY